MAVEAVDTGLASDDADLRKKFFQRCTKFDGQGAVVVDYRRNRPAALSGERPKAKGGLIPESPAGEQMDFQRFTAARDGSWQPPRGRLHFAPPLFGASLL